MSILESLENLNISEECFENILDLVEDLLCEFDRETVEKVKQARKDDVDFATNRAAVANAKATMARKKAEEKPTEENIEKANELTRLQVANAHNISDKINKYTRNIGLTANYARRHDLDKDDILPTVRDSERSYKSAKEAGKSMGYRLPSNIKPELIKKRKEDAEASVTKKNLKESLNVLEEVINELKKETVDKVKDTRKAHRDLALNNFTNNVADVVDTNRSLKKERGKDKVKSGLSKKHSELIDQHDAKKKTLAMNAETPVEANKKYRKNLDLSTKWYARHGHYGDAQKAQDERKSTVDPEKAKEAVNKLKGAYREAAKQITPHWKAEREAEDVVSSSGRKKLETRRWHKELDDWVNRDKK